MKRSTVLGAWLLAFATTFSTARAAESSTALPEMADLIIYNAKVLTVNSNFTVASAIAVKGDRILAVGRDRRLEELRGPETRIVDAQGRTIMPGLYDADVYSYAAAVSELSNAAPVIDSITNAQEYIRKQATNSAKGAWIVLRNIYPTRLKEGRLPTKEELDAATTNHPVCWDFGPMAVVNSKALEVAKIDKDTLAPAGGEIVKEPKHSKPTGLLRNAISLLKLPPAAKPATAAQERAALKHLYQLYNEQGITSIGEADATPAEIDLFRSLSQSNELTVRINCTRLFQPSADADESIDRLNALTNAPAGKPPYGPSGTGDDWVRIGPLKTVLDGDLSVGTAYLRTPYGIGPTYMISELAYRGVQKQDAFALPQVLLAAAQNGWQLSTHASGDAALDFALNCYEQVQFKLDIHDRRFLLSHTDFGAAQDWTRTQKLGLGAVLTPGSLYEEGDSLTKTLGTNRLTYFAPFKGWFNRGIVAGAGSGQSFGLNSLTADNPWNPWLGMWITLTRETKAGAEINPQEKLTREQAVRFYTYNNAWLNFEDKQKGSLEPGKLADLIMVDMDIMKCPVDEILNAKVLFTMVNGKVVWQAIEPIFPGPQEIQAVTINVTNAPVNVAAPIPVVPTPVNNQSAAAAAKHAAEATTGVNPYAPVVATQVSPAPVSAMAPLTATTASNTAPTVATTVQPAVSTNSETTATTVSTNSTAPVAQTSEAKPDATANAGASGGFAGAAPAEVAANQSTPAATSTAPAATTDTNQAPAVPATNAVPSATTTNAENSVAAPNQPAVAVTASPAQDTAAT
ncbi:MAG TPA: amidohydrolase family protein, partial [Verrucomicrobiae bacterium]|nr:amidohydrolase family protein [Verrucomicrobiae bacterium]